MTEVDQILRIFAAVFLIFVNILFVLALTGIGLATREASEVVVIAMNTGYVAIIASLIAFGTRTPRALLGWVALLLVAALPTFAIVNG